MKGGDFNAGLEASRQPRDDRLEVLVVDEILEHIWLCSLEFGGDVIVPIAYGYYAPLLLVVTVWFGIGVMFGGFDPTSVITFVLRVGFTTFLLQSYYYDDLTDNPMLGETRGFVWTVGKQGVDFGREIVDDARAALDTQFRAAELKGGQEATGRVAVGVGASSDLARIADEDQETQDQGMLAWLFKSVQDLVLSQVEFNWRVGLWIVSWVVYCQFLWGFLGLSVLGIIGPLFIPFILVPQLEWLFWGWFRGCMQTTIYMMMSGVMYAVVASLLMWPLQAIAEREVAVAPLGPLDFIYLMAALILPYIPIMLMCVMGSFQVGSFAETLMGGSGMPSGGLESRIQGTGLKGVGMVQSKTYRDQVVKSVQSKTKAYSRFATRRYGDGMAAGAAVGAVAGARVLGGAAAVGTLASAAGRAARTRYRSGRAAYEYYKRWRRANPKGSGNTPDKKRDGSTNPWDDV